MEIERKKEYCFECGGRVERRRGLAEDENGEEDRRVETYELVEE